MKGAQDVRRERAIKKDALQREMQERAEIIESLVLEKFRSLSVTSVLVLEYNGAFMVDDDITDVPFDWRSHAAILSDFNSEEGYCATNVELHDKQKAIEIKVID